MKVTVFGSGYVGLVTGACFAEAGNHVVCVDIDAGKVARLKAGEIPIYEPGLDALVKRNVADGRLKFTTDAAEGVRHGLFQFIAVGTPPDEDGSADLTHVLAVAETIGRHMTEYRIVVDKSTVPVGTADKVRGEDRPDAGRARRAVEFDVVSNPEFLKEGAAIADFMKPDRIVVGTDNPRTAELLQDALRAVHAQPRPHDRDGRALGRAHQVRGERDARDQDQLHERAGEPRRAHGRRHRERARRASARIRASAITSSIPAAATAARAFPKDVQALVRSARRARLRCRSCCTPSKPSTSGRSSVLFEKMQALLRRQAARQDDRLWGLAFKPNTDDMREAPSRDADRSAVGRRRQGARLRSGGDATRRAHLRRRAPTSCCASDADDALDGADALAIVTEWQEFRSPDFDTISDSSDAPVIFDGRNLYDPALVKQLRARILRHRPGQTEPCSCSESMKQR